MADVDPSVTLEEASKAYLAQDYQRALDLWTSALEAVENEHHYALHTNRGAALERLGKIGDAIQAYDDALQSKPDHVEALHNRGVALKAQKRFADALASFETALQHNPEFYPSWRGKTDVLTLLERFEDAIEAASQAHKIRPGESGPVTDRAFAHLKAKKLNEALEDYAAAVELGDNSSETKRLYAIALSQRAVELDKAGELAKAEEYYTKAIEIEPTESRLFNRAFLFMRTNRIDEAITGYQEVMRFSATNFQSRAALGTLLLQRERYSEAIPVLKQALALNPSAADIVYNLAFAQLKVDELDIAEELFNKALTLDPTMENAKNGLEAIAALREAEKPKKYKLEVGAPIEVSASGEVSSDKQVAAAPKNATPTTSPGVSQAPVPAKAEKVVGSSSPMVKPSTVVGGGGVAAVASLSRVNSASSSSPSHVKSAPAIKPSGPSESPSKRFAQNVDGVDGVVFAYDDLKAPGPYPDGIELAHREAYMSVAEFTRILGVNKEEFYAYPKWKRVQLRKNVGLF